MQDRAQLAAEQWLRQRPDLDGFSMAVIGRLGELSQVITRDHLLPFFTAHGLQAGERDLADAQRAQNVHAGHIGKVQIEQDQVVIINLAQIDAFFTQIGGVDVEALGLEHEFDALRGRMIIFDKQDAHSCPSRQSLTVIPDTKCPVTLFGS